MDGDGGRRMTRDQRADLLCKHVLMMKPTAPRTRLYDCCYACFMIGFFIFRLIAPCTEDKNPIV